MCLTQGCKKDWLDVKADKQQAIPTTVVDMQAILDDRLIYSNYCFELNEVAADAHHYSDQVYQGFNPDYLRIQNAYTWSKIESFNNMEDYTVKYAGHYAQIFRCNVILEVKQGSNDNSEFKHVRAQALFTRARHYYDLSQTFAVPYTVATADQDLGVPLRLNTDNTEVSKRASVKQTYEQIIYDLKVAVNDLPIVSSYLTRGSKPAAYGLLSRVYLTMGDYTNALHYANEYLTLKNELLDYNSLNPSSNVIGVNIETTFFQSILVGAYLNTQYLITQELFDSYDDNDLRKKQFFRITASGIIFKGDYSPSRTFMFTGIATDEIYLISAECKARKGDIGGAMKDLNDLLRKRWAKNIDGTSKYVDQTATDETDALRKIFVERRKELILRGLRWTDLRRLNQDPRFAVTLKRTIAGKEYTLEPNSSGYTFPFPKEAVERSEIKQNPGWE